MIGDGDGRGDGKYYGGIDPIGLDGKGQDSVCVAYSTLRRECRLVLLDAGGRERGSRAIPPELVSKMQFLPISDLMMDLDGDGIGDVLIAEGVPPNESLHRMTGSRAAVARSGATGISSGRTCWTGRGSGASPTATVVVPLGSSA